VRVYTGIGLALAAQWCLMAQAPATPVAANTPSQPAGATGPSGQRTFTPMTQSERTHHYLTGLVSPMALLSAAAGSGISQWENTPSEWKQGSAGYGRRVANSFGQHLIRQTLTFGASSALHEDNRYFASGKSGFGTRLKYAIESTFLARRDDGTRRFSYSRIGADLGTALISRAWHPRSANSPEDGINSFGITLAVQTGFNVGREFLPFLRHRR
jgi:hypothetical protein